MAQCEAKVVKTGKRCTFQTWNSNPGNAPIKGVGDRLCSKHINWDAVKAARAEEGKEGYYGPKT